MTRPKKILLGTLAAIAVLGFVVLLAANWILNSLSREALTKMSARAKRQGVLVLEPQFGRARIAGVRTARWSDLSARLEFPTSDFFAPGKVFDVHVGRADLWMVGDGQAVLEARDINVDSSYSSQASDDMAHASDREQIRAARFRCQFPLDLFHPLPSIEAILPELVALMRVGSTQLPIEIEGTLEFFFNESPIKADLRVIELERGHVLALEPEDLRTVAAHFDEPVTSAELELIANYPLRASQLLHIKNDAETTASKAKAADEQVPEDAFRHVLWSFLLTRRFGPQFAERVTNAHEKDAPGNTPAARRMDLNNNAIGRSWAEQRISRSEILPRVLTDANVVSEPK